MRRPAWRVHPEVRGDGRYVVLMLKRCRIAGTLYRVGDSLLIPAERLQVAATLCGTGAARPADERTALDVALLLEVRRTGNGTVSHTRTDQGINSGEQTGEPVDHGMTHRKH